MSLEITVVQTVVADADDDWEALKARILVLNPIPEPTFDDATLTVTFTLTQTVDRI